MPAAIREVFPNTIHRLCKWHILVRVMPFLRELYAQFQDKDFKGKFTSVVNHPLTVWEIENAWQMLLDEFELHDHEALASLYSNREQWVPAYFKQDYCGTMVSTQRGESINSVV